VIFLLRSSKMSYKTSEKRQYEQPRPSTGPKGKLGLGARPKGEFERDLIRRNTEAALKAAGEDKGSKSTE
jgi:hypothetical protein